MAEMSGRLVNLARSCGEENTSGYKKKEKQKTAAPQFLSPSPFLEILL
jgi:hypothetical protein